MTTASPAGPTQGTHAANNWKNPAASAALSSSAQLLKVVEDGIVKNYSDVDKVRAFSRDLATTGDLLSTSQTTLTADASKENDQFIPLIDRAGMGVNNSLIRLRSNDIVATWPAEREDILTAIRHSKVISQNVADQLDPSRP